MKIAIVIWELNIKGGTELLALKFATKLQESGHKVTVYCHTFDKKECYEDLCNQLNIRYITTKREFFKINKLILMGAFPAIITDIMFYDLEARKIKRMILEDSKIEKFDIINIHDCEVWRIARYFKNEKIIWTMNDVINALFCDSKNRTNNFIENIYWKMFNFIIRQKIKNVAKIIVLDKRNKNLCKKYYKRNAIIVRGGIDTCLFKNINIKKDNKKIEILANGIFFPHRRFEDLVLAAKILRDAKINNFHITINGKNLRCYNYYVFIKRLIESNNLNSYISIINGMSKIELKKTYLKTNIFVFPNHEQTWGMSVFEAMLAKCVCIVSKSSGACEVLSDGKNAIFVNPKNPKELAEKLKDIINNYTNYLTMGENGYNFVKSNLSWEKYTDDMINIFKTC